MNALSLLDSLFDTDMDYGFGCMPELARPNYEIPAVDVTASKDAYTLTMELPGKQIDDVDITIKENRLTISSVKKEAAKQENKAESKAEEGPKFLLRERRSGYDFNRSFTLPRDVDAENVSASLANGILTVSIARTEAAQPRKIQINIA